MDKIWKEKKRWSDRFQTRIIIMHTDDRRTNQIIQLIIEFNQSQLKNWIDQFQFCTHEMTTKHDNWNLPFDFTSTNFNFAKIKFIQNGMPYQRLWYRWSKGIQSFSFLSLYLCWFIVHRFNICIRFKLHCFVWNKIFVFFHLHSHIIIIIATLCSLVASTDFHYFI